MRFLEILSFTQDEISYLDSNIPDPLYNMVKDNHKLITNNIIYLRNLGVKNYKEIFKLFYEMFLVDNSFFVNRLEQYEKNDLISYLEKDINVFEFL